MASFGWFAMFRGLSVLGRFAMHDGWRQTRRSLLIGALRYAPRLSTRGDTCRPAAEHGGARAEGAWMCRGSRRRRYARATTTTHAGCCRSSHHCPGRRPAGLGKWPEQPCDLSHRTMIIARTGNSILVRFHLCDQGIRVDGLAHALPTAREDNYPRGKKSTSGNCFPGINAAAGPRRRQVPARAPARKDHALQGVPYTDWM